MTDNKEATLRVTLLPRDTNRLGTIFGGVILSNIDLAAAIEARRSGGNLQYVTVAMDRVVFHEPVQVGDLVSFYAEVVHVGRTSLKVRVSVEADRRGGGQKVAVTRAEVTYVHIDADGKPQPVPPAK